MATIAPTPPTSQRYLNLSFALADGVEGLDFFTLPVRPEDLSRNEPSRVSVVQSLDGAWVDAFGRGLTSITLSGNTGWRERTSGAGDGLSQFRKLRDDFIHAWHNKRAEHIAAGKNPDEVRLIFIDAINGGYVADVVPVQFVLRRSKAQPLLLLYNITLTAIREQAVNPWPELLEAQTPALPAVDGLTEAQTQSLDASVSTLEALQQDLDAKSAQVGELGKQAQVWTQKTLLPVVSKASEIAKTVQAAKTLVSDASQQVINLAADLSAAGVAVWGAVAELSTLPLAVKGDVLRIKAALSNMQCVLFKGYRAARQNMGYGDVYGASNCSSTAGGRPASIYAQSNTFEPAVGVAAQVVVSQPAGVALAQIKARDPLLPTDSAAMASNLQTITQGVSWPKT